jgi:multicomponent Na+:H+ antiporter subunit F
LFLEILLVLVVLLSIGSIIRILIGPTLWDRLLSLNVFSSKITLLIIIFALFLEKSYILDIAIVFVLFGFVSILFIARFIERKGSVK